MQVYAKLGGKHLGQVELRKANKTLVEQVKDLQEQVAKLLVHPVRTSNYLLLDLDGIELPSFTYRNAINMIGKTTKKQLLWALSSAKTNSRLECTYDEDDMYVFHQVKQKARSLYKHVRLHPTQGGVERRKEVRARGRGVEVRVESRAACVEVQKSVQVQGRLFWSGFTNLQVLGLETDIHVKDWNFAKRMVLKEVLVHARNVSNMDFSCLQHLEDLWIDWATTDTLTLML